jgi:hypothetical protein
MDPILVTLLAHLSAQRRLLIHAYVCGLIDEADPLAAATELRRSFAGRPTQAPEQGSNLDPAVSDMLAAMTDEAIDDFMARVAGRLVALLDETSQTKTAAEGVAGYVPMCDRSGV